MSVFDISDSANVLAPKPSVKEMNVCIEPNSSQDVPYELVVDDNVAIALHSSYEAGKNFKVILMICRSFCVSFCSRANFFGGL